MRRVLAVLLLAPMLLLWASCAEMEEPAGDDDTIPEVLPGEIVLDVAASEVIPTVLRATLSVEPGEISAAWIEFGLDHEFDRVVDAHPEGEGTWSARIWGLPAGAEVQLRGGATVDGEDRLGDVVFVALEGAPTNLPGLELTAGDESTGPGGYLITSLITVPPTALILDGAGRLVWWYSPDCDKCVITRAHLSADRGELLLLITDSSAFQEVQYGDQWIWRVSPEGELLDEVVVLGAQRDFLELDDGTLAVITMDVRTIGVQEVVGDRLVEVAPDGSEREVWNAWDAIPYDPNAGEDGHCHANAVDYDPVEDDYLLSCHRLDTIVRIDRATGETVWTLGGSGSDFTDAEGSNRLLQAQHQFQLLDGGIVVFNNRTPYVGYSEVVEYTLDTDALLAEPIWSAIADPPLMCYVLGDVTRFDDGRTLVTWSTAGQIDLFRPDLELDWRIQIGLGAAFGYTTHLSSLY